MYLRTAEVSCKDICGIYKITGKNNRISYKIFHRNEDLENKDKLCDNMNPIYISLDDRLEKLGYTIEKSADIMVYELNKNINTQVEDVKISLDMTDEWLEGFLKLSKTTEETIKSTVKFMLSNIKNKVFCVSINYGEIMIACGLGVLENKKIGLYDINVMEQYRMRGFGTKICKTIINQGIRHGADTAYLQVA